jgi:putative SOS response-associated peptidase YedK
MCGRYAITLPPEAVRQHFDYLDQPNFPPRYNIAPTQPVPVVLLEEGARRFRLMRWGLLPSWVKDPKEFPLVINIRSETAREKPSFRAAFQRRRGLMPVDGFYEWHRIGRVSQPYLFRRPDRGIFAFPALYETWSGADGSEIDTVALLNTDANGQMAAIHDRSPVILSPADYARWLDPATTPDKAQALLRPPPNELLEMIAIGLGVNRVANDSPAIQEPQVVRADETPSPRRTVKKDAGGQGSLF